MTFVSSSLAFYFISSFSALEMKTGLGHFYIKREIKKKFFQLRASCYNFTSKLALFLNFVRQDCYTIHNWYYQKYYFGCSKATKYVLIWWFYLIIWWDNFLTFDFGCGLKKKIFQGSEEGRNAKDIDRWCPDNGPLNISYNNKLHQC